MTPKPTLALVFAADEGFARATAVAMHSALLHLSPRIDPEIYVLDNGITDASRDRWGRMILALGGREIRWTAIPPDRLVQRQGLPYLTSTSYARLLIPELLPSSVTRAVYLDGDVVVKADLSPLFETGLGGAPFAAVRDFAIGSTDSELSGVRGIVESKPYFNAGVLVLDVPRWRNEGFADQAIDFAEAVDHPLPLADQDAMNAVASNWHELDFRWNVQPFLMWKDVPRTALAEQVSRQFGDLYRDAAVVHFAGSPKPWHPYCTSPGMMLWARALMRSGWYKPAQAVAWLVSWSGKRVVDSGRRAKERSSQRNRRRNPRGL